MRSQSEGFEHGSCEEFDCAPRQGSFASPDTINFRVYGEPGGVYVIAMSAGTWPCTPIAGFDNSLVIDLTTTVGMLPGENAGDANEAIDIALPTGMGPFRNLLIARACHAVIAVRGGYGTLSEIAFALRLGTPVIGLKTWALSQDGREDPGIRIAETPEEAVRMAVEAAAGV